MKIKSGLISIFFTFLSGQLFSQNLKNFSEYNSYIDNFKAPSIQKNNTCEEENFYYLAMRESRARLRNKVDSVISVVKTINSTSSSKFCFIEVIECWNRREKGLKYIKNKRHRYNDLELSCKCIDSNKINSYNKVLYFKVIENSTLCKRL